LVNLNISAETAIHDMVTWQAVDVDEGEEDEEEVDLKSILGNQFAPKFADKTWRKCHIKNL
jgi:hypothetical protein